MDRGWVGTDCTKECLEQCRSDLKVSNETVELGYKGVVGYMVVAH